MPSSLEECQPLVQAFAAIDFCVTAIGGALDARRPHLSPPTSHHPPDILTANTAPQAEGAA